MEIVSNIPFEPYLRKIIEVAKCNPLEINYQLEIIKPLLEVILSEYQIPDTSNNSEPKDRGRESKHNRYYYTLKNGTAPDLLIAKNYKYDNRNDKPDIFAAVEVKHQSSAEMFNREFNEYAIHLVNELATYMCVNNKAIATNCRRWQFFDRTNSEEFDEEFLKAYLSIVDLLWPISSKKFKDNTDYFILELQKKIEGYKQLAEKCNGISVVKKDEQWYATCVAALEEHTREIVKSCLCNTIDVLPNSRIVTEEQYTESIELDDYVKDLIGLNTQTVIKTPKEWYELIEYIPKFVSNP